MHARTYTQQQWRLTNVGLAHPIMNQKAYHPIVGSRYMYMRHYIHFIFRSEESDSDQSYDNANTESDSGEDTSTDDDSFNVSSDVIPDTILRQK